jgi:signal transduction histidine kinase
VGLVPGKKYLDLAKRITAPDRSVGAVALRFSLESHYEKIRTVQRYVAGYLGVNLLILLVIGFFRFRTIIFEPVARLLRLTDSYTEESGVPFLALQGSDELGQLAGSMQQMLSRIKADREKMQQHLASLQEANQQLIANREEMIRAEKLSSVGRLAAGLAHEIGNPVGIVQGYLGLIQQHDLGADERREFCTRAEQELQRISQLIRQLLDFSRPASSLLEDVDLHQVLLEVIALLRPQPLMDSIALTTRFEAAGVRVHCNADQLMQVIVNCLINAADAIHAAGKGAGGIEVVTEMLNNGEGGKVRLTIQDTGVGLSKDTLVNAFDPFFTTKEPGQGTGLGLSVSYALLRTIGGTISLANCEEGGAMVSIVLPAVTLCNSLRTIAKLSISSQEL